GAVEPGVACLRLATAEARACGDQATQAQCLAELGTALVHAVRGRDEEGASLLHEALALADSLDQRERVVEVCRELGYVDVQAGRATSAIRWLTRATSVAVGDAERCGVLGVRGMALSDRAYYDAAAVLLSESIAAAERGGRTRQAAWSLALLARVRVLCGAWDDAADLLDRSIALVDAESWTAFKPFPEALRAEVALAHGDPERAAPLVDHAFALGCRLGDPCWEGMAARARGLLLADSGDTTGARDTLRDAAARASRVPDPYTWVHTHILDALADAERRAGDQMAARAVVDELESTAGRCDMRELAVRAALHRARLGDPRAMDAARLLAEGIDNPLLDGELVAAVAA
ncbi:MAG: hypothetical protein QOJ12_2653, partial [Thermoleophilales bacterium]|nr:hypothetical protein [Thermoleophilales bacterium]